MSTPREARPVKLIIGIFLKDRPLAGELLPMLTGRFGEVDMVSQWFPFDFTDYYADEMGAPLFRRLFSFKQLVDPGQLADIKLETNKLEGGFVRNGKRRINIDPGYMADAQFVLATGKNYSHRIYIGKGIFADLTLVFHKGTFSSLPWTYPDYAGDAIGAFLLSVRKQYFNDMKQGFV